MKWMRQILLVGVILLGALQFIPVERTNPPVESDVPAPDSVRVVLRRACYDCHSNETVWPWYSHVAPVSFLIAYDVRHGREELNYSTWNRISPREQVKKLKESWETTSEGEMPPWYYLAMHREAALSTRDRAALKAWATTGAALGMDAARASENADGGEED